MTVKGDRKVHTAKRPDVAARLCRLLSVSPKGDRADEVRLFRKRK